MQYWEIWWRCSCLHGWLAPCTDVPNAIRYVNFTFVIVTPSLQCHNICSDSVPLMFSNIVSQWLEESFSDGSRVPNGTLGLLIWNCYQQESSTQEKMYRIIFVDADLVPHLES